MTVSTSNKKQLFHKNKKKGISSKKYQKCNKFHKKSKKGVSSKSAKK